MNKKTQSAIYSNSSPSKPNHTPEVSPNNFVVHEFVIYIRQRKYVFKLDDPIESYEVTFYYYIIMLQKRKKKWQKFEIIYL